MCAPVRLQSTRTSGVPTDIGVSQGFVGALGVRWDAGTGLYYMRNRWYDAHDGDVLCPRDELHSLNQLCLFKQSVQPNFVDP